ncbi:MAG: hypothetical protein P4M11_04380 [Candidatus Pacebacteria bacterium]|nr:hypothetical protein [Candidatus Paceibacterota bacterium]
MVRTAVFTITLKVYKRIPTLTEFSIVKQPGLVKLLTAMPSIMYFGKIACYIRDLWLMLDDRARGKKSQDYDMLNNLIDDSSNMLLYVEDIMNSIPEVAHVPFSRR